MQLELKQRKVTDALSEDLEESSLADLEGKIKRRKPQCYTYSYQTVHQDISEHPGLHSKFTDVVGYF